MNSQFRIAFGHYELQIDRKKQSLSLTDITSKIVWANDISIGRLELIERSGQTAVWHEFSTMKVVSVTEKMGPAGKKLLVGLEALSGLEAPGGIPVDLYFTCTQTEIQLTVEATRDSPTHTVGAIELLPGLARVPDTPGNFLVTTHGNGRRIAPGSVTEFDSVWNDRLFAPFFGAIRTDPNSGNVSAIAILTDSAYATQVLTEDSAHWRFEPDPERRRLDLRILVLPDGDPVAIARNFRDKMVGERAHVPLKKKLRERENAETRLLERLFDPATPVKPTIFSPTDTSLSRWDAMEAVLESCREVVESGDLAIAQTPHDWFSPGLDAAILPVVSDDVPGRFLPLRAVTSRDSVLPIVTIGSEDDFLDALLLLAAPRFSPNFDTTRAGEIRDILRSLVEKSLGAFLVSHRFPTDSVEEAVYSNRLKLIVNRSDDTTFESEGLVVGPKDFAVVWQ